MYKLYTKQIIHCTVYIFLFLYCNISYSDNLTLNENLSDVGTGWTDTDFTKLTGTSADQYTLSTTSSDIGLEQVYGFSPRTISQAPACSSITVRIYGKKTGSPSSLRVNLYINGFNDGIPKVMTFTDTYTLQTATWNASPTTWTANQLSAVRIGLTVPSGGSGTYTFNYIYINAGEDEDENYDGVLDWGPYITNTNNDIYFTGGSGGRNYEKSGQFLSRLGDINGDNVDDFGIAAGNTGQVVSSRFYLIFGSSNIVSALLSTKVYYDCADYRYGQIRCSYLGNVTGTSCDDIMLGLNGYPITGWPTYAGGNFLIAGKSSWTSVNELQYWSASYIYKGTQYLEAAQNAVGVGDVNGDNINDFVVGSPGYDYSTTTEDTGAFFLNFGTAHTLLDNELINSDVAKFHTTSGAGLGYRVSPIGNINNDDYDDFVVSFNDGGSFGDMSRIYLGRDSTNWGASAYLYSDNAGDHATYATNIGDFNGDNVDDFAVGAPDYIGANPTGKVYLIWGSSTGWSGNLVVGSIASCSFRGLGGDHIGSNITGLGDLDGDGYDDIAISNGNNVYLVYGKGRDFCINADIDKVADTTISGFGSTYVTRIGDVNNDEYPDFAIGDCTASSENGITYVFFGGGN